MRAILVMALIIPISGFSAPQGWKPKLLSPSQESRWIKNVKSHKTADGSTVAEVLAYVQQLRPHQFKVSEISIGYNGATGEPDVVTIGYWIGKKRRSDDAFVDLGYAVTKEGHIKPVAENEPTLVALEGGREVFLHEIDVIYATTCKPDPREKPSC